MPNRFPFNTPEHPEDNRSINKAFDRNYGNRLKSGDTTPLKYTIKDGDGEPLDKDRLMGMETTVKMKHEGVTAYEAEFEATLEEVTENYEGDLVARYKIMEALPPSDTPYIVEFHFEEADDRFIFPSGNNLPLYITPSSLNSDGEAIKNASEQRLNEIVERKLEENPVLSEAEAKELARQENYQELLDTGVMQTKINERLEDLEEEYAPKLTEVTAQLAQTENKKVDKDGSGQVKWANIAQDAREQILGEVPPAVVGIDSVTTENITDNAVTFDKTQFSKEVAKHARNMIVNGNFAIDSDGDGKADGWLGQINVSLPRLENNTQYWMPLSTTYSGTLLSKDLIDFIGGHKYYISVEQTNINTITSYGSSVNETLATNLTDEKVAVIYEVASSMAGRIGFNPKTANVESSVSNLIIVDLTETFGAGNEPDLDYFKYLLKMIGSNKWFDTLNLINASKNGVITARELQIYDKDKSFISTNVNDVLLELAELATNAPKSDLTNLFTGGDWDWINCNLNTEGSRITVSPKDGATGIARLGKSISLTSGNVYYIKVGSLKQSGSYRPLIGARTGTTVSSTLAYSIHTFDDVEEQSYSGILIPEVDANFIHFQANPNETTIIEKIMVLNLTEIFGSGNEPTKEIIENLLSYIPSRHFEGSLKIKDFVKMLFLNMHSESEDASQEIPLETEYKISLTNLENKRLSEEVEILKENTKAIFNLKMSKAADLEKIALKNTTEQQKLILHLHKRENDGFDTANDAYLPNAEDDFSDIRITSDDGSILPYRTTVYRDDLDVISDSRLGINAQLFFADGNNDLISLNQGRISKSSDDGKTWVSVPALTSFVHPIINLMLPDYTILFNHEGTVYRSEVPYTSYDAVFDLRTEFDDVQIRPKSMVRHPDGELFFGNYQLNRDIKIYKSVDNGMSWQISIDLGDEYQHVHAMYVDEHTGAVYAALDGGGGVLKTTDKGETWVDLRDGNPNMPNSTDFGVRYADATGYRLLSGETAVTGGHSILKTTDDINFRPVLSTGASVHYIYKLDGKLFASGAGTGLYRHGVIYISEDEGETWKSIYNTSPLTDSAGTNDGYRNMSLISNQIIVGCQSPSRPPLRILQGGKYAELVVTVPAGASSINVESGYAYTNKHLIHNDTKEIGDYLVNFNFNEGGKVIKEIASDRYFEGDFEWANEGKHLSYFYPYIISPNERLSVATKTLHGFKVDSSNFDVSEGITISYWSKSDYETNLVLFSTDLGSTLEIFNGYRLHFNGEYKMPLDYPIVPHTFKKIDITIDSDGNAARYSNGILPEVGVTGAGFTDVLTAIQNSTELTVLNPLKVSDTDSIQHFSIRKGVVSDKQLYEEYHSFVTDNNI